MGRVGSYANRSIGIVVTEENKKKSTDQGAKSDKKIASGKKPAAESKKVAQEAPVKASEAKAATKPAAKKPARRRPAAKKAAAVTSTQTHLYGPDFKPYKAKAKEVYMNPKQCAHFRAILIHWKEQLITDVTRTVNQMQDDALNFPDTIDRAAQEAEFNLELRTRDRERKLIKKINQTLANIDNDNYGYCDSCGADIGITRLEVRPTATLCFECKTIEEIRERQSA